MTDRKPSWCVVVPTNRPGKMRAFRRLWAQVLEEHQAELIVVEDNERGWESLPWFVPRETDMIRSFGIYDAWRTGCDFVLTVDDDTAPIGDPFQAYERAFRRTWPLDTYLSVGSLTNGGREMRGFPYRARGKEAVVQYGGWDGVLDYDARTQLAGVLDKRRFARVVVPVPYGCAVTGSSMNLAFRREYAPIMWQLPVLDGCYKRFGDIWSGLIVKRVMDRLGKVVLVNGRASVLHDRASDPQKNLELEKPGQAPNEGLWEWLSRGVVGDMVGAFVDVTDSFASFFRECNPGYADHFVRCRDGWLELFR